MTREGRLLSLYLGLTTAVNGFLQPFVPIYLLEAGLTKGQIGLVAGAGAAMAVIVQPILGRLSDRLDVRRPFVAIMATLGALAYLSFPYLKGLPAFLFAVALGANAFMYLQGVGGVLVGRLAAKGLGGTTYAAYRVWGSVGYVFVALGTGLMLHRPEGLSKGREPLDLLFHTGPLIFLGVAAMAYWLPDPKRPPSNEPLDSKIRMHPNLLRFLVVDFLYIVSLYGATHFISMFTRDLGGSGLLLACIFVPGVVAEVLVMRKSGIFSDLYGRRPVLAISYLLLPIRLVLYSVAMSPWWVFGVQTLHGLNFGIVGAVAIAMVNDQADHHTRGALQARLSLVTACAGTLGPSLMGFVAERYGIPTMFLVAAALALIATVFFLLYVDESNEHARGTGIEWLDHSPLSLPRERGQG